MKLIFNVRIMLFMLSLLFGCSLFNSSSDYEKIADKIIEKTAEKLKEQTGLSLVGTGGQMMNDIQMMAMSFDYYQEVDLKTARKLLVYAINEYLSAINNNQEIRPYLHEYPFTAKNVEIRIWICNKDGTAPSLEKVYYISAIDGILDYYIHSTDKYSRKAICEESYEEAFQRISRE